MNSKHGRGVSYAKYGYLFILPFFIVYIIFTLIPQLMTFYYSLFENYNYWNFTLFWGIRVRESPGFFFLHQNCPWNQYTYVILIGIVSIALTGWIL